MRFGCKIMILSVILSINFITPLYCDGEDQKEGDVIIPATMETIKEGDVTVMVPKGGRIRRQGSIMLIETADEYASRKFTQVDDKFTALEKELEAQRKEIEDLKQLVKKLTSIKYEKPAN